MRRKGLWRYLLIGLLSLILGVSCLYFGTVVFAEEDLLILLIVGGLLTIIGLFFIFLFIAPGTVLKILRQR